MIQPALHPGQKLWALWNRKEARFEASSNHSFMVFNNPSEAQKVADSVMRNLGIELNVRYWGRFKRGEM